MNKILFLICFLFVSLFAADKNYIVNLYKKGRYARACVEFGKIYTKYKADENFLNLFAYSCLKSDHINRMVLPIIKLNGSPSARANAAYFTTILYQKKLLYNALIDGVDISYVKLPKTDYILSEIFCKYVKKDYVKKNGNYLFKDDKDNSLTHEMSVEKEDNIQKIYIKSYKDGKIIKTRSYW